MKLVDKLIYDYLTNSLITKENTITLNNISVLDEFVKSVMIKKATEKHHIIDSYNEAKRWRTGMGGELALEQFLGKNFVDLTIGDSKNYHTPDLSKLGLSVGIKTVELGKFPIIFKNSKKPEIIILKLNDDTFSILGLASVNVLNKYYDDEQILSPSLKSRGTKTAFVGLHSLKTFKTFEDLVKLL